MDRRQNLVAGWHENPDLGVCHVSPGAARKAALVEVGLVRVEFDHNLPVREIAVLENGLHGHWWNFNSNGVAAFYSQVFGTRRFSMGPLPKNKGEASGGSMKENKYIAESGWPQVHGQISTVSFQIQSGPIKEFGENGCQIDDVILWAKEKIEGFNKAFPCRENSIIITKLDEALLWSLKRKMDREARAVEGRNVA